MPSGVSVGFGGGICLYPALVNKLLAPPRLKLCGCHDYGMWWTSWRYPALGTGRRVGPSLVGYLLHSVVVLLL
jgi:hypothetical protein